MPKAIKSTDTRKPKIVARFKKEFEVEKVTTVQETATAYRARLFKSLGNKRFKFVGQGSLPKYVCTICGSNGVDVDAGENTCQLCLDRQ